jgi:hypothetical protein
MLRSILSAAGRAVAWAANKCVALMMMPVHALLAHFFPAAYEPLPTIHDNEGEELVGFEAGLDPFGAAEGVRQQREIEVNRILAWAADAAYSRTRVALPDVRSELLPWLTSLSNGQLDALISAGKNAAYGHLYFSMAIPGVPAIFSRGGRQDAASRDPTFSTAECGPAAAF